MRERKGTGVNMRLLSFLTTKKCFFDPTPVPSTHNIVSVKNTEKKNSEFLKNVLVLHFKQPPQSVKLLSF